MILYAPTLPNISTNCLDSLIYLFNVLSLSLTITVYLSKNRSSTQKSIIFAICALVDLSTINKFESYSLLLIGFSLFPYVLSMEKDLFKTLHLITNTISIFLLSTITYIIIFSYIQNQYLYNVLIGSSLILTSILLRSFFYKFNKYSENFIKINSNIFLLGKLILILVYSVAIPKIFESNDIQYILLSISIMFSALMIILIMFYATKEILKNSYQLEQAHIKIHKYPNWFKSISNYIDSNDFDGLKKYFNKNILPIRERELQERNLKSIENMKIESIYNLFYSYLKISESSSIKLNIEISDIINKINIKESDLFNVLSIYIDNAFKFCPSDGAVIIKILKDKEDIHIIIQNDFSQKIEIHKVNIKGYSSNGGTGQGLYYADMVLSEYNNIITRTWIENNKFNQFLTINMR